MKVVQIWRPAVLSKFTAVSEQHVAYIVAERVAERGDIFAQALLHFEQNKGRRFPEGSYS